MRRLTLCATLVCLLLHASHADQLPELGDPSATTLNSQQEHELGESIMRQLRSSGDMVDDPDLSDYLHHLGYRLASSSPEPGRSYDFFALKDRTVNAFALPGGHVGIHTGLILAAQSESELASVLGHEISHITQKHMARRFEAEGRMNLPLLAATILAIVAAHSNSQVGIAAATTTQAAGSQLSLNYSREHEREADRIGIQTMYQAGFDPRAMPRFFEKLQKSTQLLDNGAFAYLRTHPLNQERIADSQGRAEALPYRQVSDSPEFLLLRERLRTLHEGPQKAIEYYSGMLQQGKFSSEPAYRYGFTLALLQAKEYARAEQELARLRKQQQHPYIEELAAQLALAQGQTDKALAIYQAALNLTPDQPGLVYGQIDALLQARRNRQALVAIAEHKGQFGSPPRMFKLEAQAYAALGSTAREHQALAEYYSRDGNPREALTQIQLALKVAGSDFYLQSSLEARQRELRAIVANAPKPQQQ